MSANRVLSKAFEGLHDNKSSALLGSAEPLPERWHAIGAAHFARDSRNKMPIRSRRAEQVLSAMAVVRVVAATRIGIPSRNELTRCPSVDSLSTGAFE